MQAGLWEDYKGIRRFSNTAVQKQIDKTYKKLEEENKTVGVVAHTDESGDWKISAVIRKGDNFSIMAAAYDNWKNPQGLKWEAQAVLAF